MGMHSKITIRKKVLLIPLFGALGFISYILISINSINHAVSLLDEAKSVQFPLLITARSTASNLEKIKDTLSSAVSTGELDLLNKASELASDVKENLYSASRINTDTSSQVISVLEAFNAYYELGHSLSKGMVEETIDYSVVPQRSQALSQQLKNLQELIAAFDSSRMKEFEAAFEVANTSASEIATLGIMIGCATIFLLFLVAIPVSGNIKKNLDGVITTLRNIAEDNGDLTVRLKTNSADEIGELVYWFNSFVEKLQNIVKDVVSTAEPLAEASNSINRLSSDLQSAMTTQSNSTIQAKQSVDQMSQSVTEIAKSACEAAESATKANVESEKGKSVVSSTITDIQDLASQIDQSAKDISQLEQDANSVNVVLDVIKGIAEQTNLLALNAAIEAARAGEQGRGFAVVADEVRGLASRTQESTEEIHAMLAQLQDAARTSVTAMESSTSLVHKTVTRAKEAGDSLETISARVGTINSMNDQIAVATEEQQNISMLMVDHVDQTQEQTERASAYSMDLQKLSDRLNNLAGSLNLVAQKFKV